MSAHTITVGAGLYENRGRRLELDSDAPTQALMNYFASLTPDHPESWWIPGTFLGDVRQAELGESWCAVGVDADYYSPDGKHGAAAPTSEDMLKIKQAAIDGDLPGSTLHATPHGVRLIFVLEEATTDKDLWERAAIGAHQLVKDSLAKLNLLSDKLLDGTHTAGFRIDSAGTQPARFFWCPKTIDERGLRRDQEAVFLRDTLHKAEDLAKLAPPESEEAKWAKPIGERITHPDRHNTLTSLGGTLRARGLDKDLIFDCLRAVNLRSCHPPVPDADLRRIADFFGKKDGPIAKDDPVAGTDTGNAARLAAIFGDRIRWCGARSRWYSYDGLRWVPDHGRQVEGYAKELARLMLAEAAACEEGEKRARLAGHALKTAGGPRIRACVDLCRSEPGIAIDPGDFDSDPFLLNCKNGTLDLRTMELREHDPADLLTMLTGAPYDCDAVSEVWERILGHALPDPALRDFFARLCGSFLEGLAQHDIVIAVHGQTGTSKSTALRAVLAAMGDYARATDYSTFAVSEKRAGRATPELAALVGRRLVLAFEGAQDVELDAERIKRLCSGDPGAVRDLFQSEQEMRPRFKIVLVSNYRPTVSGDPALWRRLREVPFRNVVENPDPALRDRVQDEPAIRAGVIAWMICGYIAFKARGLEQPEAVSAATSEFRHEADPFEGFIEDECQLAPDAFALTAELNRSYIAWADNRQEKPLDWDGEVVPRLKQRGCKSGRRHAGRGWCGIRLKSAAEQAEAFAEEVGHA